MYNTYNKENTQSVFVFYIVLKWKSVQYVAIFDKKENKTLVLPSFLDRQRLWVRLKHKDLECFNHYFSFVWQLILSHQTSILDCFINHKTLIFILNAISHPVHCVHFFPILGDRELLLLSYPMDILTPLMYFFLQLEVFHRKAIQKSVQNLIFELVFVLDYLNYYLLPTQHLRF